MSTVFPRLARAMALLRPYSVGASPFAPRAIQDAPKSTLEDAIAKAIQDGIDHERSTIVLFLLGHSKSEGMTPAQQRVLASAASGISRLGHFDDPSPPTLREEPHPADSDEQ